MRVEEENQISDEDFMKVVEIWKDETGYNIMQIENEEERIEAYCQWVLDNLPKKLKGKPLKPSFLEEKEKELREKDPVFDTYAD